MRTAGVDLASQPKQTAVCVIDWGTTGGRAARVDHYSAGWTDDHLIDVMSDPGTDRIGIDAPFGWPIEFVTAISAYRDHGIWPVADPDCLRYRATERQLGGGLSPSLDQLVWIVLRCARLLDRYARQEATGIDRTGEGRFVEVYPAAALDRWGMSPAKSQNNPGSYKGDKAEQSARRERLMGELAVELVSTLDLPDDFIGSCNGAGGDHLVDALVAALVARSMAVGNCDPIPSDAIRRAQDEGWIRLPHSRLSESVAELLAT